MTTASNRAHYPDHPTWLPAPMRPGFLAIRKLYMPFLAVQAACLLIVAAYYVYPSVQTQLDHLAKWSKEGGWLLAGLGAALAGGVLPEIIKISLPGRETLRQHTNDAAFNFCFFFINGTMVYFFYLLQSIVWGDGVDVKTVFAKVVTDQALFNPLMAMPYAALMYRWRLNHFRLAPTFQDLTIGRLFEAMLPIMIPAQAFWIPSIVFIYSLPRSLQYVLFLLALAAWSIVMTFVAGQRHKSDTPPPIAPAT